MGNNSQSHYSTRAGTSSHSRSRASTSRHAREPDRHHDLKTSLQVIGLLICMRVLLPKMFPSEHEPEAPPSHRNAHQQSHVYVNDPPPPPYSRAQLRGTTETGQIRRIEPAYSSAAANHAGNTGRDNDRTRERDVDGISLDGTTAYGSDAPSLESEYERERERTARRRERRREREGDPERNRRLNSRR